MAIGIERKERGVLKRWKIDSEVNNSYVCGCAQFQKNQRLSYEQERKYIP